MNLKNKQCPYCGSHNTMKGLIVLSAIGVVLAIVGILFRPLTLVGILVFATSIVQGILQKFKKVETQYYCKQCHSHRKE